MEQAARGRGALDHRRLPAAALLVAVVAVIAFLLLRGSDSYEVKFTFENASQLVNGDQVKVGGLPIGKITKIDLDDRGQAVVTARLTAGDLTPLHEGSTAVIRINSLSSVANRFIALNPGPSTGGEIHSGGVVPAADTRSQVELDSVLNTLDAATRSETQRLLRGSAGIYPGAETAANRGLAALDPALSQLDAVARELARDKPALQRFLVKSAAVVGAVADRNTDLQTALDGTAATAQTLADRSTQLNGILAKAPATLDQASGTLDRLGTTFTALLPAARELRPVAAPATKLVAELQPLLTQGPSALRSVNAILPDLRTVLRAMPALRNAALPSFRAVNAAVDAALPIVDEAVPYLPELYHGIISGFGGGAVQSYDANGHYARIAGVANTQVLQGLLQNVVKDLPTGHKTGLTNRCPGGAYEPAADGSSPVKVGDGACDASAVRK